MTDSKNGRRLACQAIMNSWKDFNIIGDDVLDFKLHVIGETGDKIPRKYFFKFLFITSTAILETIEITSIHFSVHDIEKAMQWDWLYKNSIELHVDVRFAYCIEA